MATKTDKAVELREEFLDSLRNTLSRGATRRKTAIDQPISDHELQGKIDAALIDKMLTDPGVSYPISLLELSILRSGMVYKNKDSEIEEFVKTNLKELKATILRDATRALEYGFAPFERRWIFNKKQGVYFYKEFIPLNPAFVTILVDKDKKGFGGIKHEFQDTKTTLRAPYECYVYSHDVKFSNLYGISQVMFAWLPWILDREFWRYHALAAQEFGVPTLIGKAPAGDGTYKVKGQKVQIPHHEILGIIMDSIRNRSNVTLPGMDYVIEMLMAKRTTAWDFEKDHKLLDLQKARAILVPSELWREGGGSYAKARTQSFWFEIVIEAKLFDIAQSVMRHIIKPLIMMNFQKDKDVMPPMGEFYFEPHLPNITAYLEKLTLSPEAAEAREEIDWEKVFTSFKVPLKDEEEEDSAMTFDEVPINRAVVTSICQKAFFSGIDRAKEDFGVTEFIPVTDECMKDIDRRASEMAQRAKKVAHPSRLLKIAKSEIKSLGYNMAVDFSIRHNLICKQGA
jgi:hypothetical protein